MAYNLLVFDAGQLVMHQSPTKEKSTYLRNVPCMVIRRQPGLSFSRAARETRSDEEQNELQESDCNLEN